jgi:hypothetical protein
MRKIMLSLVLAAGVVGLTAATPSQANAQWWMQNRNTRIVPWWSPYTLRIGPMGSFSIRASPLITPFSLNGYNGFAFNFPSSYRLYNSPNAVMSLYRTGGYRAWAFNPSAGYLAQIVTPAYTGYTISPYVGYQPFTVPSQTFNIPISNANVSPFYLAYLRASFFGQ